MLKNFQFDPLFLSTEERKLEKLVEQTLPLMGLKSKYLLIFNSKNFEFFFRLIFAQSEIRQSWFLLLKIKIY